LTKSIAELDGQAAELERQAAALESKAGELRSRIAALKLENSRKDKQSTPTEPAATGTSGTSR
jgi:hypothetical protein